MTLLFVLAKEMGEPIHLLLITLNHESVPIESVQLLILAKWINVGLLLSGLVTVYHLWKKAKRMRLFIDGDGSPVKEDVIKLGESYGLDVVIVTSVDHYTTKEYANHVQIVYVDRGADSADYKIVGMVKKNDF